MSLDISVTAIMPPRRRAPAQHRLEVVDIVVDRVLELTVGS
jgi:hypothetical protein